MHRRKKISLYSKQHRPGQRIRPRRRRFSELWLSKLLSCAEGLVADGDGVFLNLQSRLLIRLLPRCPADLRKEKAHARRTRLRVRSPASMLNYQLAPHDRQLLPRSGLPFAILPHTPCLVMQTGETVKFVREFRYGWNSIVPPFARRIRAATNPPVI